MHDTDLPQTLESIAANVRRLRLRHGLTQEALAETADLDLRMVQRVEGAETNMKVAALVALARALEVSLGTLMRPAKMPERPKGRPIGKAGVGRKSRKPPSGK